MRSSIKILGLDADDTLWQNEEFFRLAQDRFADLLSEYITASHLHEKLLATERKNLGSYGYGIKGFILSMVETAIDVTGAKIPAHAIYNILRMGQDMLNHPIRLLPGVAENLPKLAESYHIVLITKGDLLHQEQKLAQSGLGNFFDDVQIVSEKEPQTYRRIFGGDASRATMAGNSISRDRGGSNLYSYEIWLGYGKSHPPNITPSLLQSYSIPRYSRNSTTNIT